MIDIDWSWRHVCSKPKRHIHRKSTSKNHAHQVLCIAVKDVFNHRVNIRGVCWGIPLGLDPEPPQRRWSLCENRSVWLYDLYEYQTKQLQSNRKDIKALKTTQNMYALQDTCCGSAQLQWVQDRLVKCSLNLCCGLGLFWVTEFYWFMVDSVVGLRGSSMNAKSLQLHRDNKQADHSTTNTRLNSLRGPLISTKEYNNEPFCRQPLTSHH